MTETRFNNPRKIDVAAVHALIGRGLVPVLQFSEPTAYPASLLRSVDALCAQVGPKVEVRFYGHYQQDLFDAAALEHLPNVARLSIDCLTRMTNGGNIGRLARLTCLSFGVFDFDQVEFLAHLRLESLTQLSLETTRKANLDLAPLARCHQLEELRLQGHTRSIASIGALPRLRRLVLGSIPKKQDLAFVNRMASLRSLTLVLGGRTTISELEHEQLEALNIIRVRGLEGVGNLARFPALQRLLVEDQLQIGTIDVSGAPLRVLRLINCKTLERVDGLETLDKLHAFRVAQTRLDVEALMTRAWPPSLKFVGLYSGSGKWNRDARARLDARGYEDWNTIFNDY